MNDDMTEKEYRADKAVSQSRLKLIDPDFGGCPADYRDALDNPIDTDTHSRRGLRLVHTLCLEPQHFERDYFIGQAHTASIEAVQKKIDAGTKGDVLVCMVEHAVGLDHYEFVVYEGRKGSKDYKEKLDEHPGAIMVKVADVDALEDKAGAIAHDIYQAGIGKTRITQTQYDAAKAAADAVRSHAVAGPIVTNPDNEYEGMIWYTDPATGLKCKGRADVQDHAERIVWDLKSMRDVSPRAMVRDIGRMRYHVQGAHYTEHNGYGAGIIGVAKCKNSAGYRVTVLRLGDAWMSAGREHRARLMAMVADCTESGHWPDHNDGAVIVDDEPADWVTDIATGFDDDFTSTNTET